MKKIFLLIFSILFISIITQQNNQQQNKINNTQGTKNNQTISNNQKNTTEKPKEKEFNLTESLLKFFDEVFGSNKTNKTDSEQQKKIEEQKRIEEEKRKEEMRKRQKMEQIRMENERLEKEKAKKKQQELEREREEFERQVENITVSEFTNLYLEAKSGELLYHNITKPCNLKIIFLLTDTQKTIHLMFNGPNGRGGTTVIKSFRSKNFLYYVHDAKIPGQYTFYLNNYHNSDETEVIFAINDDSKAEESLGKQKVDKISGYLNDIDSKINIMRAKQNLMNKKAETHNDSVNKHNRQIFIYSVIEVITMLLVFVVQTFYIKSIVEKL